MCELANRNHIAEENEYEESQICLYKIELMPDSNRSFTIWQTPLKQSNVYIGRILSSYNILFKYGLCFYWTIYQWVVIEIWNFSQ